MCEFTGLDFEMAIEQHYNEALFGERQMACYTSVSFPVICIPSWMFSVIHRLFRTIFDGLEQRYAKELSTIREQVDKFMHSYFTYIHTYSNVLRTVNYSKVPE